MSEQHGQPSSAEDASVSPRTNRGAPMSATSRRFGAASHRPGNADPADETYEQDASRANAIRLAPGKREHTDMR